MGDAPVRRTGRPTLDDAAALQQHILDEALRLLRNSGSDGFSVEQLAIRTSVTKRTIYRRYKSKEGLINAVVSREIERLISNVTDPGDCGTSLSRLHSWSRAFFDYVTMPETIAFYNYLNFEAAINADVRRHNIQWHDFILNHTCSMILDGQNEGLIRHGEPRRYALLLLDLLMGLFLRAKMNIGLEDALAGEKPEDYFAFRWAGFLSLVKDHPSEQSGRLARGQARPMSSKAKG